VAPIVGLILALAACTTSTAQQPTQSEPVTSVAPNSTGAVNSTPPSSAPTVATTSSVPPVGEQWWIASNSRPNHEVLPLPTGAPPAPVSRERALEIAHDYVDFDGQPTAVVHGMIEVIPDSWKSAWVIIERYENPSPHPISGPCCSPHFAVTAVAGVAISDQTGEFLHGWQDGNLTGR
jgi:hypothetical protein